MTPRQQEAVEVFKRTGNVSEAARECGRRALQSMTFHKNDGLVVRALDPIDRDVG